MYRKKFERAIEINAFLVREVENFVSVKRKGSLTPAS